MADETQTQATTQSSQGGSSQSTQAATASGAQSGASQTTQSQATTAQSTSEKPAVRPDWVPESFWLKDKNEVDGVNLRKSFDELSAFRAAEDTKRLSRPQKPEDYKSELPTDFKLPAGVDYKLDDADPLIGQYRSLAIEAGLDQATFSKGLGLIAAIRVGEATQIKTARDAEIAKLGPNASARVDAVTTWAKAMVGDEAAGALSQMLVTSRHVEAFEGLIKRFTSQGAGSFSQQHRENAPTKLSEDEYAKLSPRQKLEYAQKFNGQAAA